MLKMFSIALFFAAASQAAAQSNGLPVEGQLLSGWREADGRHMSGLALDLAPGWKTYWRAPGSGGIPPRFNWSGSKNLASVEVRFPVPKVMDQNGIQAIGYDRDMIFPLIVSPRDPARPVSLRAEVELGICEDVCIPVTLRVRATLPPRGAPDAALRASLANRPDRAGTFDCEVTPIADGLRIVATTTSAAFRADAAVVETGDPDIWVSPSDMRQSGSTVIAVVEMVPPSAQPFAVSRNDLRLTLIGGGRAVEMQGCR